MRVHPYRLRTTVKWKRSEFSHGLYMRIIIIIEMKEKKKKNFVNRNFVNVINYYRYLLHAVQMRNKVDLFHVHRSRREELVELEERGTQCACTRTRTSYIVHLTIDTDQLTFINKNNQTHIYTHSTHMARHGRVPSRTYDTIFRAHIR